MAKVLIVEDDRASARLLSLLLKKGGHEVTAAHTLEVARKWLQEDPEFDLMILDNRVGDDYGWELLGELRAHFYFRELPVIVYTAAGDRDSVAKYVELRVQNIRAKPYSWGVLAGEIDKAMQSGWQARDFESAESVRTRLQISAPEYYTALREFAVKLRSTSNTLLELLSPQKERQFLILLTELRSQSVNFGVGIVQRVIKECVESFKDSDWSRAVKSVRAFNLVAKRIEARIRAFEAEGGSLDGLEEDDFEPELPPEAMMAGPSLSNNPIGQMVAAEVPTIFRRMTSAFAQGDTVEMLVRKCVRGTIPQSKFTQSLEPLKKQVSWLAFLEPSDLEPVAEALRAVPGLEERVRRLPFPRDMATEPLREVVSELGVFQAGLVAASMGLRDELHKDGFPVRLDYILFRQFLSAQLVRVIASKIQRPVNLEAVVWLQFLGEWAFAIRFPGVYGLLLLEPVENPVVRHRSAFEATRRPLVKSLQLPAYCRESLYSGDLEQFTGKGAARLTVGLHGLSEIIGDTFHAEMRGSPIDAFRDRFLQSPSWELLLQENLKLPSDRQKFFDTLLGLVPNLHRKVELLLSREKGEVSSRAAPNPAQGAS